MSHGTAIAARTSRRPITSAISHRTSRATEAMVEFAAPSLQACRGRAFDALRDVGFEIPQGEAVGIIGRNGAGKSTLLKILSRITEPTAGARRAARPRRQPARGGHRLPPRAHRPREHLPERRASSACARREIARQFDEIVDFAEVEQFLDTPVKRYSQRHVRAAGVRRRRPPRARDPARRRGARGGRRRRSSASAWARCARSPQRRPHRAVREPPDAHGAQRCTSALFLQAGRLAFHGDVDTAMQRYRETFEDHAIAQLEASRRPGSGRLRADTVRVSKAASIGGAQGGHDPVPSGPATSAVLRSCHVTDANGVTVVQCDSRLVGTWLDPEVPHELSSRSTT